MTTYVICDNCGHKFPSNLIQVENLETNRIGGNTEPCPNCKKQTLLENRNLVNE